MKKCGILTIKGTFTELTAENLIAEHVKKYGALPKEIRVSPFYLRIAQIIFNPLYGDKWFGITIGVDPKFYEE